MKTIKFFHPEETFLYYVEKCFCKVVYSGQQHQLLVEIHSTDDLDHVEADSIQNDFPQVILSVDDFPVSIQNLEELEGQSIDIPLCYNESEDEDGDVIELFYTNVNFSDENYEADSNHLQFFKNEKGILSLKWKGKVQDFTEESENMIPFEVECSFVPQILAEKDSVD